MTSTSPDRDEIIYNPDDVPPKAQSFPGTAPRYQLYQPPRTKVCYFYKDGDRTYNGLRVTVNHKHYPNVDILKKELTRKVPGLPFGVRSIYTPRGRHSVGDIETLEHGANYVCSTHQKHAKGVDITSIQRNKPWHGGRAPSGKRAFSRSLREAQTEVIGSPRRRPAWGLPHRDNDDGPFPVRPKKITVIDMERPTSKHVLLLNRRTIQTFEQIMTDVSQMFQINARKLFTTEGRPIRSLSAIFNGPDLYLVTDGDHFKPMTAKSDPPRYPIRRHPPQQGLVANRLKEKRDRLSKTPPKAPSPITETAQETITPIPPPTPPFVGGKWKVWVTTNELPSSGTEAEVTITVYGHKGNSGPLPLGYGQGFRPGNIDEYERSDDYYHDYDEPMMQSYSLDARISVGNIGEIYKIRVGHDNHGDFPGWFLDEVRMEDQHTQEELIFKCRRWLSRDEDDGEICRELPAVRDREDILPVVPYEVAVFTGDLWNAGTDANVYITMYGERGDTGVRQLFRGHRTEKFRMGQLDIFTVEAVSLGPLKRAIIGHDGTGTGQGWYLEKIVVKEGVRAKHEWTFPCYRWLDEGEEDGKLVRELKPVSLDPAAIERRMFDVEKWKFGPDATIMLFSKVTQRPVQIKSDTSVDAVAEYKDIFGQFRVVAKRGNNLVLQNVANSKYHLALDNAKVMGKGKGGSYCEFQVRVQEDRTVIFESAKYKGQTLTFAQNGRAVDPRGPMDEPTKHFHVYCKGMFRDQGVVMLCTSVSQTLRIDHDNTLYATGKRDKLAHFKVHKKKAGGIRMFESTVFIGHFLRFREGQIDCKGNGDKYCEFRVEKVRELGYVTLESVVSRGLFVGMTQDGRVRPVVNTGDRNSRIYPQIIEYGVQKRRHFTPPREPSPLPLPNKPTKHQRKARSPTPPPRSPTPTPRSPTPAPTPQKTPTPEPPKEKSFEEGDWKVWVTTDEGNDGGDVAMVVYGDQGNSKPIIIGTATDTTLFQTGNQDEFKVNLLKVGKIYKIRLELHAANRKKEPAWKVKELKMKDMTTTETLKFKYNRWLSKNHDDGDTMRELGAIRPKQPVPQLFTYQVHVYTGDEAGAETDANVYIIIFGEKGDTGKRLLHRSDKRSKFQEGQVDRFELEAVDLGVLKRCIVSHDGDGAGEGWYLDKVIVRESEEAEKEYLFPCHRWLDTSIEDQKIERVLKAQEVIPQPEEDPRPIASATKKAEEDPPEEEEEKPKDGDWRVWIITGREDGMGTRNEITLVAYGDQDVSEPKVLGDGKEETYFQQGNNDDFKVNLGTDLGDLYKIRVGHNDETEESGWFLEKVKMKNLISDELLTFKVNRWLSRSEEDQDVWRELPVVRPGKQPLPVLRYTIEVYTGAEPGADTEASLYIQLIGKRGDSGKRVLYHSKNNDTMFQEGQVDIFDLEAVDLDDIVKVVVGHDEKAKGAGWYCDKVIVKTGVDEDMRMFYFPCGRWFDKGQEEGKTERELLPKAPPKQTRGEYHVVIQTNNRSRPNNGSAAMLVVYGEKGKSRDIELLVEGEELFEAGNIDEFELSLGDIGEPYKIRIGRQDMDNWEGWLLDEVKMRDKDTKEEYVFKFNRWMDRNRDDCDVVRELPVTKDNKPVLPVTQYEVSVYTGDRWAADTDASVYMTLYGTKGDFGKRWLYKSRDHDSLHDRYQRNQVDTFLFESVTLQDLKKLVIGHNGAGNGAGWFLDKVVVKEVEGEHSGKEFVFPCGRWLDDQEEDKKTERELKLLDIQDEGAKPKPIKKGSKTQGQWKVRVKTSDIQNAGTHAQIHLTVYGDKGDSWPKKLGKANPDSEDFEKGKEAEFTINVGDIGTLFKIRLDHDNTGNFPGWHAEQLTMEDAHTGEEHKFYVNRWLAVDEEDGSLCRELAVSRPGKPVLPVLRYYVAVYTANIKEAATTANVFLNIFGENGDCGKRALEDAMTHNIKWLQGQVDIFTLEAVQLGKLTKVTLEHDGRDKDSAWFVEKVIIKEGLHAQNEFAFRINDWIEPQDEGQTEPRSFPLGALQPFTPLPTNEQQLLQGSKPKSKGSWTAWTLTGTEQEEPLQVKVTLTLCGTEGSSDPTPLVRTKRDADHKFESGKMDQFKVTATDIGPLVKVRIVMDVREGDPEWFLKRLKLKDATTKEEFHFHHNDWVKKTRRADKNDPEEEVIVEMAAVRPDLPPLQDLRYRVTVVTGDEPRADTDAHMYCVLAGHLGDTGRRRLLKASNNKRKLRRGQEDIFEIPAIEVGKLSKVILGHDAIGKGCGWLCDKVKVKEDADAEIEVLFPCNRWFDTGCDDRKIERELTPLAEISLAPHEDDNKLPSNGEFKVGLKMGDNNNAAKNGNSNNSNNILDLYDDADDDLDLDLNANNNNNKAGGSQDSSLPPRGVVSLIVYGDKGKSEVFELDPTLDDLSIFAGNIGEVYKVRVCNGQDPGPRATWNVQEVSLQDAATKEKLVFDFTPWMGEVGGDTCKEVPAIRANRDVLSIIKYQVSVFTAKDSPNVPKQASNKGQKAKAGDKGAKVKDKPTIPDVFISLMGSQGDSGARHLTANKEKSDRFQAGKADVFMLEAVDLGEVDKVIVHKMPEVSWKLEKVIVKNGPFAPKEGIFDYDKVFEERHRLEPPEDVEIPLSSTQKSNTAIPKNQTDLPESDGNWKITMRTGTDDNAGASCTVTVTLCGEKGETREYPLPISRKKGARALQPGQTDEFMIHVTEDIGEVTKVRVAFEDDTNNPSWFLDEVKFQDTDTKDEFTIEASEWIMATEEVDAWREYPVLWPGADPLQMTKYQVEVYTGDHHKGGTKANAYLLLLGQEGSSGRFPLRKSNNKNKFEKGQVDQFVFETVDLGQLLKATIGHDAEKPGLGWFLDKAVVTQAPGTKKAKMYEFECERWLDRGEDDKAIERVLEVSDAPIQAKTGTKWKVIVKTHDHQKAAPEVPVVMVLYGSTDKTQELPVGEDPQTSLQPAATEEYEIMIDENLGDLYKVRVGYPEDQRQSRPSWLMDELTLQNQSSGKEYKFVYTDRVEVTDEDDGWTEIPVQEEDRDDMLPVITYTVEVHTADIVHADTTASVYMIMYGDQGDTGKRQLLKSNNGRKFKQGQVDKFQIRAVDLKELKKITIGHDGKGRGAGWFLDKLVVIDSRNTSETIFNCGRWLDEGEDDGHTERDLQPMQGYPWKVTVSTNKQKNACPGAQVVIVLYGDSDKSLELPLGDDPQACLQPGRTEDYDLMIPQTLGDLYKVRVGYLDAERPHKPFWYLDKLRIEDETLGKVFEFLCNEWVSVTEEEDGWVEIPVHCKKEEDKLPVLTYKVQVHTADIPNAGTNANVYIVLHGERGDTGKRLLLKSNNKTKFQQGQVDEFELKAVDLGEVQRVTAGHDGKGAGAGWNLNKVVIVYPSLFADDREPSSFINERWMDEGEDDGKLERDLAPDKGTLWKATVTTGKPRNASPGVQVVLVMYGDNDKSDELPLGDEPANVLKPGTTETFDLLVKQAVGDLYKIRVGYPEGERNNKPLWCLDTVLLEDQVTGKTYEFQYNDRVNVTDEQDGWTEIAVEQDRKLPVIPYVVDVRTADFYNAATNANAYMIIYGERGDTGKRQLLKSNNEDKFEEGQTDRFEILAVDLGEVNKVTVGHDEESAGAGWFLDRVVINNPSDTSKQWLCECERWLDTGEDDHLIERDLEPSKGAFWTVTVTTGNHKDASPGTQVLIILYGDGGKSEEIPMGDDPEKILQSGKTEDFEILVPENVGNLYKVRVGYSDDDRKDQPSWFLNKMKLTNHNTDQEYEFVYNARVKVTDEHDGWTEIALEEHQDIKLPVVTYMVDVHTGDRYNAGTDANVYLILHGNRGDTGKRQLLKSQQNTNKFEQEQVDTFEIQAVHLEDIVKVTAGHDGRGAGSGWFLDKVVVHDPADKKPKTFLCNNWLDEGEADFLLERDLELAKTKPWTVTVTTGKNRNACPKNPATIVVYGTDDRTHELSLGNHPENHLQSGAVEDFEIEVPETVGEVYKIRVGYPEDDWGNKPSWFLDKVKLRPHTEDREYEFVYNDWVKVTEEQDGWTEIPLHEHQDIKLPVFMYVVDVYTTDRYQAGTNANVHMILHGNRGDTGKRRLLRSRQNTDKFEEGQIDTFEIYAVDLGDVTKVTAGHDGKGAGSGWHLDKVVVHDPRHKDKTTVFMCGRWLDEDEEDGLIERDLLPVEGKPWKATVTTGRKKDACPKAPVIIVLYGTGDKTEDIHLGNDPETSLQPGATEDFEITVPESLGELYKVRVGYCEEDWSDKPSWWLSKMKLLNLSTKEEYEFVLDERVEVTDEEDGWVEIPVREHEDIQLPVLTYTVEVHTKDEYKAGTNANVYMMLHGDRGDTGRRQLLKSQENTDKFEQDQVDTFEIKAVDLGLVNKVTVGHDGKGAGAGWRLDKVVIRDSADVNKSVVFYCNRWLDEGEQDGRIELDLERDTDHPYIVTVTTCDHKTAAPNAQVVLVMYGQSGRSEELPLGDNPQKCLQSGQTEEYEENVCEALGDLYKIRVGYREEAREERPSWKLDKIHILEKKTKNQYEFVYNGWVKVTAEEDGWVEIPLREHEDIQLPVLSYRVDVHTGDKYNAGTNANVYMNLHGNRGDTGKRQLLKSQQNTDKFEEDQIDTFEILAVDLEDINKVTVGHDGKGAGAGWFLNKVVVYNPIHKDKTTTFECNRFLDECELDGKIELDLIINKKHPWKVTVTTANQKNSSPGSEVILALYGENGRSEDICLGNDPQTSLQPGKTEDYEFNVEELIGDLYKVRVGYPEDEQKKKPFWMVEKMKLEDLTTGEMYEFVRNERVTITTVEDGWIEIPLQQHEDLKLPVHTYSVEIHTSPRDGAGTEASGFIMLHGKRGDTGHRKLLQSDNKDMFRAGQCDKFEIKAVDLDDLTKVTVGHDGKGPGAGWFIDRVVVKDPKDPENLWCFKCGRWLDEGEGDGKIVTDLEIDNDKIWKIWTISGKMGPAKKPESGKKSKGKKGQPEEVDEGPQSKPPTGTVVVTVYGEKGKSDEMIPLVSSKPDLYKDGQTDDFEISISQNLGKVYKVRVGYSEDTDEDQAWFLHTMVLRDVLRNKDYGFEVEDFLIRDREQDGWKEIPVKPDPAPPETDAKDGKKAKGGKSKGDKDKKDPEPAPEALPVHKYVVEVHTGTKENASTDANVYLTLYGQRGDTGKRRLLTSDNTNKFQQGQVDKFEIAAVDLLKLEKVTVGHDGKGLGSGWYLDRIVVNNPATGPPWMFDCDKWLDEGEDDGLTERDLELAPLIDNGEWKVQVITGSDENSGTDAQVTLTAFGDKGNSGPLPLGAPDNGLFGAGNTDEFDIVLDPDVIGKITKIRIQHDKKEEGSGWKLDKIIMDNKLTRDHLEFSVDRWLDKEEDDGDLTRELAAEWPDEEPKPVVRYTVQTVTGNDFPGSPDTEAYITLCGQTGDSGKRFLHKSKEGKDKFGKGQKDTFDLEAIDLGTLEKVIVGHDQDGSGSGWYLDKVIVKETEDGDELVFPCDKWLDKDEDDGLTERELVLDDKSKDGGK